MCDSLSVVDRAASDRGHRVCDSLGVVDRAA